MAANVFPSGRDAKIGRRALYLAHSTKRHLPLPHGDFLFGQPIVFVTPSGDLQLVWAEGKVGTFPNEWPSTWTTLWHASFRRGRWTTPERVAEGAWLHWDSRAKQVIIDENGQPHLVVNVAEAGRGEQAYHVTWDRTGWRRNGIGIAVSYPSLASLGAGRLVLAYVVGEQSSGATNQLYTRLSSDSGRTWTPPERVLASADTHAVYWTQLRALGDTVYLGWVSDQSAGATIWGLSRRILAAGAHAQPWTAPVRSPPLPGVLVGVTFALNGCGGADALADLLTPERGALVRRLRLRDGRIQILSRFSDAFATASLIDRAGDRMIEIWSALRAQKDAVQPFFRELSTCR